MGTSRNLDTVGQKQRKFRNNPVKRMTDPNSEDQVGLEDREASRKQ